MSANRLALAAKALLEQVGDSLPHAKQEIEDVRAALAEAPAGEAAVMRDSIVAALYERAAQNEKLKERASNFTRQGAEARWRESVACSALARAMPLPAEGAAAAGSDRDAMVVEAVRLRHGDAEADAMRDLLSHLASRPEGEVRHG